MNNGLIPLNKGGRLEIRPLGQDEFRSNKFYAIVSSIFLVVGLSVYIVFRPDTRVTIFVMDRLKLSTIISPKITESIRAYTNISFPWLEYIFRNYVSDFCWGLSLEMCLGFVFRTDKHGIRNSSLLAVVFLTGLELWQLRIESHGTFDPIDILVEVTAVIIAGIMINKYAKEKKTNEKTTN